MNEKTSSRALGEPFFFHSRRTRDAKSSGRAWKKISVQQSLQGPRSNLAWVWTPFIFIAMVKQLCLRPKPVMSIYLGNISEDMNERACTRTLARETLCGFAHMSRSTRKILPKIQPRWMSRRFTPLFLAKIRRRVLTSFLKSWLFDNSD